MCSTDWIIEFLLENRKFCHKAVGGKTCQQVKKKKDKKKEKEQEWKTQFWFKATKNHFTTEKLHV